MPKKNKKRYYDSTREDYNNKRRDDYNNGRDGFARKGVESARYNASPEGYGPRDGMRRDGYAKDGDRYSSNERSRDGYYGNVKDRPFSQMPNPATSNSVMKNKDYPMREAMSRDPQRYNEVLDGGMIPDGPGFSGMPYATVQRSFPDTRYASYGRLGDSLEGADFQMDTDEAEAQRYGKMGQNFPRMY
jgi:hypothetical protein